MSNARTHLAAVVALGAALAAPIALAQSQVTPEVREAQKVASEGAAAAAQDPTDADAGAAAPAAATAAPPAGRQLGWADVDADGNGTISREESAALPALAAVFAEADADGNGELTPEEYRAHAAAAGGGD